MAAVTWSNVEALAPELAGTAVPLQAQAVILEYVNGALDGSLFGGEESARLRLARIWLAAHFGTQAVSGGASVGKVASETVGQISRTYVTSGGGTSSAASGAGLLSTTYGTNYLAMIQTSAARGPVLL